MSRRKARRKHQQSYGNPARLSTSIADAVGANLLGEIVDHYLDLLETSAAIYESNGDYALEKISSGWCRFMDESSRNLCGTDDDRRALDCGKWHCHESCWKISKAAVETEKPADEECAGGIRIRAVPIVVGGEAIGAINLGYGDPPKDPSKLKALAEHYGVNGEMLAERAESYEPRPPMIVEIAKSSLVTAARLIAEIVEHKQAEEALRRSEVIVANSRDMLALLDKEFTYLAVNPAYLEALGMESKQLIGHTLTDAFGGEIFDEVIRPKAERCLAGEVVSYEAWLDLPGIGRTCVDVRYAPHLGADDEVKGFVISARNTTERKQTEEHMLQAAEDLTRSNAELQRFNRLAVGREQRMIELKRQVNELLAEAGEPAAYDLAFVKGKGETGAVTGA